VQMPSAGESKEQRRSVGEVIVNVKSDGTLVMNRRVMTGEELLSALKRVSELYPDQAVVLRGDKRVDYGNIVRTLDLCRQANIWNVAFATAGENASPSLQQP
jgi:biopolymer transport protein ExbD